MKMSVMIEAITIGYILVASVAATQTQKPNIVFFMADDTGWFNVGWHNPESKQASFLVCAL